MKPRLTLLFSATQKAIHLDNNDVTIVGRSSTCTLRVDGLIPRDKLKLISRRHFRVTLIPGEGYVIEDLASRNGTQLNGLMLLPGAQHFLKSGDLIQLAKSDELQIEVKEESGARTESFEESVALSPLHGVLYRTMEGDFVVDGQLLRHSSLSTLEYRLLDYLYDNAGRVCAYNELAVHVWGYPADAIGQSNTVSKTISNLRRKLDERSSGSGRRHIQTAHGRGVKLVPL